MQTIRATVSPALLQKATRLFTGSEKGRVIEILQNARRAGATKVTITNNADKSVTVRDNGCGIEDFAMLLALGASGWEETTAVSEDPAGVGVFCLSPNIVTIRSRKQRVTFTPDVWTGAAAAEVQPDDIDVGTEIVVQDCEWLHDIVEPVAVFSKLEVWVDGAPCASAPFVSERAVHYPELGCKVEIIPLDNVNEWHERAGLSRWSRDTLLNFYGQTTRHQCAACLDIGAYVLVEMTGEPTGIRLLLPARTRLVDNEALTQLELVIEQELYKYVLRQGSHTLSFDKYKRAHELGIQLPEARPVYEIGFLESDDLEPPAIEVPAGFPLASCYLEGPDTGLTDMRNAHNLAAYGKLNSPFVPVRIKLAMRGYSWAKLPYVTKVELVFGNELRTDFIGCNLRCVDKLEVTVHTSDGNVFRADVPVAYTDVDDDDGYTLVTLEAEELDYTELWYHCGGYTSDDSDSYDTQRDNFIKVIDRFWAELGGLDVYLMQRLFDVLSDVAVNWQDLKLTRSGSMTLTLMDGTVRCVNDESAADQVA